MFFEDAFPFETPGAWANDGSTFRCCPIGNQKVIAVGLPYILSYGFAVVTKAVFY